jgi:DNA-binding transcriptional LysR family regulator
VLFHRLPRAVRLTEAGALLLKGAREVLGARDRVEELAAQYQGLLWGRLELHASTIPGEYLLPGLVARFKERHPHIRIRLHVGSSADILRRVAGGDALLGFVGERDPQLGLEYVALWRDRIGLYRSAAAPGDGTPRDAVDPAGVERLPLILRDAGSGTRNAVEAALRKLGVEFERCKVVAEFGSTAAVKEAVKAGAGVGFLSDVAVRCEVEGKTLVPVEIAGLPPVRRLFHAVWDPRKSLPPAASAFLDLLRECPPEGAAPGVAH